MFAQEYQHMAKSVPTKKLKGVDEIRDQELASLIDGIANLADASSKLVYVYSYVDLSRSEKSKRITVINGHLRGADEVSKAKATLLKSPKAKKAKTDNYKRKWAVRLEGNKNPVSKTFATRDSAMLHAQGIVSRGKANKVEIAP